MTDARGDHDDVPGLEPVALTAHQIFHIPAGSAVEQLVKAVAVEIYIGVAYAHIPVGVYIPAFHFQFLVQVPRLDAQGTEDLIDLLLIPEGLRLGQVFHDAPQF